MTSNKLLQISLAVKYEDWRHLINLKQCRKRLFTWWHSWGVISLCRCIASLLSLSHTHTQFHLTWRIKVKVTLSSSYPAVFRILYF